MIKEIGTEMIPNFLIINKNEIKAIKDDTNWENA